MRTLINTNGVKRTFGTDQEFLAFARKIYTENEEGQPYDSEIHFLPENVQQATEYISEYCPDIELSEE